MSTNMFDDAFVAGIVEDAIEYCMEKTGARTPDDAVEAIHKGKCQACDYLKYRLAKRVGEYLGSMDDTVKSIYVYEPEYGTGAEESLDYFQGLNSGINLIAWVDRKTAALASMVISLNEVLVAACGQLDGIGTRRRHLLDVKLADDRDVREGIGYGTLVNSLNVRPMEVWSR